MNAAYQGPKDRAPARVGQVLRGKWRLDELLAVGGMASVFAATHRNGKRGAVKLLHYELSLNEESRTRFLREGYVANRVDHEGAVSVLDDDICDDGTVFLVMELLDGQTIDALLRARNTRAFGLGETLRVADRLLDVLAAAHDKGVVHRDIKPENLFITKRGQLKVLDFGIARLRESAMGAGVTRAGDLLGTPSFMSPEQALGNMDVVDARSDLWSVGATIFRLLTGRPVHVAESVNRVLLAAMTMPAQPITRILPTIPPQLAAIVDRALAFEQKDRWPDARSMLSAVRAFAHGGGVRMEGSVLATPDEARARPATLPLETSGPPLSARPLPEVRPPPAAGLPAYTTPPPGVHNPPLPDAYTSPPAVAPGAYTSAPQSVHTPPAPQEPPASAAPSVSSSSEMRRRDPAAPVPFASAWSSSPAPLPEAPVLAPADAVSMSVSGLLADADDDDPDAKTNVRETMILDTPGPAPAGHRPLAGGSPAPTFGSLPADPSIVPAPLGSPHAGAATNQPPAPPTPSFDTVSPLARADAPGERPITLAPAHTPHFQTASQSASFSTASPVSRDPTFGTAPRSTRVAPFIVLGAVVVLAGLLAVVLLGDSSPTEGTPPGAAAPVLAPATATPAAPADTPVVPASAEPSSAATASAAPQPTAEPAAPPLSATAAAPQATSPSAPATTSQAPKPPPSSTAKRPQGGAPKGDPFSSRKW